MKNEQYFYSIYWLMLISAFTYAFIKIPSCFLTLVNALWTTVNQQWTTVFLLNKINKD